MLKCNCTSHHCQEPVATEKLTTYNIHLLFLAQQIYQCQSSAQINNFELWQCDPTRIKRTRDSEFKTTSARDKDRVFFPQLPAVKARIPKALVAKPQWTPIVQIKIASKSLTGYMAGLPVHHSWQAFQSPAPWARCKTCHGIVSSTSLGKVTSGNLESAIPQLTWHSWSWNEHFKIPFRTLTLVKEQMPVGDSKHTINEKEI